MQYTTPRNYGWLGEHQDEAAELAALLHEAAPKLALASLRAPVAGARPLPKARSYEVSDTIKDRLRAAEPMPTGGCTATAGVAAEWPPRCSPCRAAAAGGR